jgi:hypothetical protein
VFHQNTINQFSFASFQLLLLAVCFIGTTWSVVPLQWNNGNFDIVQYANKIVQFFNSVGSLVFTLTLTWTLS